MQGQLRKLEIKVFHPEAELAQSNERIRGLATETKAFEAASCSDEGRFGAFGRGHR